MMCKNTISIRELMSQFRVDSEKIMKIGCKKKWSQILKIKSQSSSNKITNKIKTRMWAIL